MIAMLTGTLVSLGQSDAIIQVGGVGYYFQASSRCLARMGGKGAEVTVLIDTQIRDDRIILTGFADAGVKDAYHLLQTVQGVGVKAALAILSALSPDDLVLAISAADKAMITRADGVGPKLAQRIVNELAEKVSGFQLGPSASLSQAEETAQFSAPQLSVLGDAVSALVNLGYGRSEAHAAVTLVMRGMDNPSLETVLPLALKELGR
jgi:Holliday junction DNA helicase RuvA